MIAFLKHLFTRSEQARASAWVSTLAAASEELADDSELSATIPLPCGVTFDAVVSYILNAARNAPDHEAIMGHLTQTFGLTKRDALTAIDRTLGGVVRASASNSDLRPDRDRDPLAWHSFQAASADHAIIEDIYPGMLNETNRT